jgi:osmotically-inducible protein OsmY
MTRRNVGLALALWSALGLPGSPQAQPAQSRSADDERIEEVVQKTLVAKGFAARGISVRVRARVVYLTGSVEDAREKLRVIEAAFAVPDVDAIESELQILRGVTPELEEGVWRELMAARLDGVVSEVAVKDGIATLRGEAPDESTRDRVIAAARRADGIASVRDELTLLVPEPDPAPEPDTEVELQPEPEPEAPAPPTDGGRIANLRSSPPNLAQQIAYAILTYSGYTVFDHVQFSHENGEIVLLGAVTGVAKKRELEERIRAVPGVERLTNEIRVLPQSKDDDRLREKLFRRIYEDELFAPFAHDANPPIHIIVEGGVVTLTGVVDETIQKMSAEAIVKNVFEVTLVRNRIRVRRM